MTDYGAMVTLICGVLAVLMLMAAAFESGRVIERRGPPRQGRAPTPSRGPDGRFVRRKAAVTTKGS